MRNGACAHGTHVGYAEGRCIEGLIGYEGVEREIEGRDQEDDE